MIKTNFNQSERRLRVTVAVLLISVITMLPLGFSQTVKAQTPSKAPARAEPKGGQVEGIKVHGHWTIDLRNPDGTLVTHREFENAFNNPNLLGGFLARQQTPGQWIVILQGNVCSGGPAAFPTACIMDEFGGTLSGAFHTLTVDIAQQAPVGGIGLLLKGQAT